MFPYPESLFGPEYHAAVYAVIVAIIAFTILPFVVTLVQWTRPPQILDFWVFIAILIIWFCAYVDPIHRSIQSTESNDLIHSTYPPDDDRTRLTHSLIDVYE